MSVITRVRAVPRSVVGAGLTLARLPVSAAARATNQQDNDQWPPTLAFEGFEAGVETVVGSLLRDDTLVARGRVRQAKVDQVRKAASLETVAEQKRQQADTALAERRETAAAQRKDAAQRAEQQKAQARKQAAARSQEADRKATTKAATAAKVRETQEQLLARQEREAKAEALAEEATALRAEKQALDAEETVVAIDDAIEASKATRDGA